MTNLTKFQVLEMYNLLREASNLLELEAPNHPLIYAIDDFLNKTHDYFFWLRTACEREEK
jgi:hypothetical protein